MITALEIKAYKSKRQKTKNILSDLILFIFLEKPLSSNLTMETTTSSLLCLLVLLPSLTSAEFELKSSQKAIDLVNIKPLQIRCSSPPGSESTVVAVNHLRIMRVPAGGGSPQILAEAYADRETTQNIPETLVEGQVGDLSNTYLRISWPKATEADLGTYRCNVVGFDKYNEYAVVNSNIVELKEDQLAASQAQLSSLQGDFSEFRANTQQSINKMRITVEELEDACDSLSVVDTSATIATLSQALKKLRESVHEKVQEAAIEQINSVSCSSVSTCEPKQDTVTDEPEQATTGSVTDEPEQVNTVTDEPEQESTVTDEPKQENTVTVEPEQVNTVTDEPEQVNTVTDEPEQESTVTDEPEQVNTVADEPEQVNTVTDEPEQESTVTDEPEQESTVTDEPEQVNTVTDEPEQVNTLTDEPEQLNTVTEKDTGGAGESEQETGNVEPKEETGESSQQETGESGAKPVVWPSGPYGLLEPRSGCPESSWEKGYVGFHTESVDENVDEVSNPEHLAEPVNRVEEIYGFSTYMLFQHFCINQNNEPEQAWPVGSYCINRVGGSCPAGFSSGYVDIDEEDLDHQGEQAGAKVDMFYYCCRADGPADSAIVLPTSTPFFLYRYGGQCQAVQGMQVSSEYMTFDTENEDNQDSYENEFHPDGQINDVRMELCYYSQ